jgi:dihydrolipoamide dehydrogenase
LASSTTHSEVAHFADHGIEVSGEVKVNLEKMITENKQCRSNIRWSKILMDKK